ncbi:MAG: alpha/beta fold hydrolase [Pseudomonadota bacterium]
MSALTYVADALDQHHGGIHYRHTVLHAGGAQAAVSAVVIVPNFMGIVDSSEALASEFLQSNRDVLILDVYGMDRRPASFDQAAMNSEALRASPNELTAQLRNAIESFVERRHFGSKDVAILGFCFGGAVALELARTGYELRAAIALHADLESRFDSRLIRHRTKVLTVQGSADPLVPLPQIQRFQEEMASTEVAWQLMVLGGLYHAFTDPGADTPGVAKYDTHGRALSFRLAKEFIG